MPRCPKCGGGDAAPLSPGFWECRSEVLAGVIDGRQPIYRVCAERYQDGPAAMADMPQCACGMFAIGTCVKCNRPLCGLHGSHFEGKFLCRTDRRAAEEAKAARKTQKAAEAHAALRLGTVEVLGDLIGHRAHFPHSAVRYQNLTGAELASVVPAKAWSDCIVGEETYGLVNNKTRFITARGYPYEKIRHMPSDSHGWDDTERILAPSGDRITVRDSGGWHGGHRSLVSREPSHQVVFPDKKVREIVYELMTRYT